jgi:hypothetical protein
VKLWPRRSGPLGPTLEDFEAAYPQYQASSAGVEFGPTVNRGSEAPPPPADYPLSGSACYACPGTKSEACCQYGNYQFTIQAREKRHS